MKFLAAVFLIALAGAFGYLAVGTLDPRAVAADVITGAVCATLAIKLIVLDAIEESERAKAAKEEKEPRLADY